MEVRIIPDNELKKHIKWLMLVKGLAAICIGFFMLFKPTTSLALIMVYIGIFWLIDGISQVYASVKGKSNDRTWIWPLAMGIISVIAAIIVFAQPTFAALVSSSVLVTVIGIVIFIVGILSLVAGVKLKKRNGDASLLVSGMLASIIGLILIARPLVAVYTFLIIIGILLIIAGAAITVTALNIKIRSAE